MQLIDLDDDNIKEGVWRYGFKSRQDIVDWLNRTAIVDAVPVIYAHWDDYYCKCSNCGKTPFMDGGSDPFAFGYEYCPYCGAMMENGD